jgi:CPA2 family monovalent cation:H+ antiporter-2
MELSLRIVSELAVLFGLAAAAAVVFARLRIPAVLGYLIAGALAGPSMLGWITQVPFVRVLGDLGVILIMFGLGLDFDLRRLRRSATISVVAGVASVLVTFVMVNAAALLLGMKPLEALFLAAGLSICGTAVNLKILSELGHLRGEFGQAAAGTIVVTDIAAVFLLTALSGVALSGGLAATAVAISLLKAIAYFVLAPALGFATVPRLLNLVTRVTRSREAVLITTLSLCFGMAMVSQWLGFSLALGAFVTGMVISEARDYHPIEDMTKPLEQIFGILFFFSVGLSVEAKGALPMWPAILFLSGLIAVSKLIAVTPAAYLGGFRGAQAIAAGFGLVPIGEFSFVIMNEAVRFGVLPQRFLAATVWIALLTSAIAVAGLRATPLLKRKLTELLPPGPLNLLTLLQLRTAGVGSVPGLEELTRPLQPARRSGPNDVDLAAQHRALWAEARDIGINLVVIVTIALSLRGLSALLEPWMPRGLDARLSLGVLAVILCAPPIWFVSRRGTAAARLLSEALRARFAWVEAGLLRGALIAAGAFLLVLFLMVAIVPSLLLEFRGYSVPVLVVAGAVTVGLAYFSWRAVHRFQLGLSELVRSSLARAASERERGIAAPLPIHAAHFPDPHRAAARAPYRTMIDHLLLESTSILAGKSIGESGLRETAGVTLLGVERGGEWIGNPPPSEILLPGDELVVIGSEAQRIVAEQMARGMERARG